MFNKTYSIFFISLLIIFFTPIAFAQDQESFPFDNQCLKYDKANFKVGQALLDLMKTADFPQYCVLYSLSGYQIKEKRDEGYFIIGSKLDPQQAEITKVYLKASTSKPIGRWAYFVGMERFIMANGEDKEFYTFQEISLK